MTIKALTAACKIGKILKELRVHAGLSQAGLARASGVHLVVISRYERGIAVPSIRNAERLLNTMGYGLGTLAGCWGGEK